MTPLPESDCPRCCDVGVLVQVGAYRGLCVHCAGELNEAERLLGIGVPPAQARDLVDEDTVELRQQPEKEESDAAA